MVREYKLTRKSISSPEDSACVALAALFFLDVQGDDDDFEKVAKQLKKIGWSREETADTLVQLIAPHLGANLGFLIWPVIGNFDAIDSDKLLAAITRSKALRANRPGWHFLLSDLFYRRMLKTLELERLLQLL